VLIFPLRVFACFGVDTFGSMTEKFCASAASNRSEHREVLDEANRIQTVNLGVEEFPTKKSRSM
jgi:hypothetical protein